MHGLELDLDFENICKACQSCLCSIYVCHEKLRVAELFFRSASVSPACHNIGKWLKCCVFNLVLTGPRNMLIWTNLCPTSLLFRRTVRVPPTWTSVSMPLSTWRSGCPLGTLFPLYLILHSNLSRFCSFLPKPESWYVWRNWLLRDIAPVCVCVCL